MAKTFQKSFHDAQIRQVVGALGGSGALATAVTIELRPDERRPDAVQHAARGFTGKPKLINPGGFDVYVNGARWGRTSPEPKGVHGALHYVEQANVLGGSCRASVEVPRDINPRFNLKMTRHQYFSEWSDKHYLRVGGAIPKPMPERLVDKVADAIRAGALRDPVVVSREAKAAEEKRRADEAARLANEGAEWTAKAREAIGPYAHGMAPGVVADLAARIVDAMKWAQSQ